MELADTYDLGSYVVRHAGSSPVARTMRVVITDFVMTTLLLDKKALWLPAAGFHRAFY